MKNGSNILNNLYVVESPLQALCALEVSLGKAEENHSIIARLSGPSRQQNNQQILNIIKLREWNNTVIIEPITSNNRVIAKLLKLNQLATIKWKFKSKVDSLYIGEFRYEFMHQIRCAVNAPNVILLDDGAATVKVIQDYIKNNRFHPDLSYSPKNIFKRIVYLKTYGKYLDKKILNKKINVLTAFAKKDSTYGIDELKFDNIKLIYGSQKDINDHEVYFYGSKYSEAGIVSLSYEINFLGLIKKYYEAKGLRVTYFPHRDESEKKLKILAKELGFTIKRNSQIAELQLLNSTTLPKEIAGVYTSTLNNIKCLFPELRVTSFRLNLNKIDKTHRNNISDIYQYYSELDINIESFD